MSLSTSMTVNFVDRALSQYSTWVKMEQEPISETGDTANLYDIFQMIGQAAGGLSSKFYTPDIDNVRFVGGTIYIDLDFWVFPSSLDLAYSLSINQGDIGSKGFEEVSKSGNIVVPLTSELQMPYLVTGDSELAWETPVYDSLGNLLESPEITIEGPYITFPQDVFGILRANIKAQGYKYTATLSFPKAYPEDVIGVIKDQTQFSSIKNVSCTVICSFQDEESGETMQETLTLEVPDIIADLLGTCPSGNTSYHDPCFFSDDPDCEEKESAYVTRIYYSTCDGEIITTIRSDGGS